MGLIHVGIILFFRYLCTFLCVYLVIRLLIFLIYSVSVHSSFDLVMLCDMCLMFFIFVYYLLICF